MRHNYNTEQFQAFKEETRERFLGQIYWRTQLALQQLLEADSQQQMTEYLGLQPYERTEEPKERGDSRNGFYQRDYVTPMGTIRLRVRRTRKRSFLPRGIRALERRSPEVAELIRQAFLRGISTRAVGRVVALLTDEPVSATTGAPHGAAPRHFAGRAGVGARAGREPNRLGGLSVGFAAARAVRPSAAVGAQRRLRRTGRGDGNRLSPRAAPARLGAQDAQPARRRAAARSGPGQTRCAAHLPGPEHRTGAPRLPALPF